MPSSACPCRSRRRDRRCSDGRVRPEPVSIEEASRRPHLSVVVTVFNEAGSIEELWRRTTAALDGRDFEVIFVDDGSTDGSFAAVERLRAEAAREPVAALAIPRHRRSQERRELALEGT